LLSLDWLSPDGEVGSEVTDVFLWKWRYGSTDPWPSNVGLVTPIKRIG